MNYRHAFHAGNFADCMKHALLVRVVRALHRKPAPIFALDTHAGIGRYHLGDSPARRTGEWRDGIGRLLENPPSELAEYVGLVRQEGLYPGSPALLRALARPGDRIAACELHPQDAAALRTAFRGDRRVGVHQRDGWEAIRALLPPPERRGLVLIDPPYEREDEAECVIAGLRDAATRFAGGALLAWYPLKHRAPVRALHESVRAAALPDAHAAEIWLRPPEDAARLNGCGLLLIEPPWGVTDDLPPLLDALVGRLAWEAGAGSRLMRLTGERGELV